jgi:hypothetical protein
MRSIQKGKGGLFSSTRNNSNKNSNKNNKKHNTVKKNNNLKNAIKKTRDQIDKFEERSKNLLEEIEEDKKKAVELNRNNKKTEAINKIKKYKQKESEIEKLNVMIQNLKKPLVELMLVQKKSLTKNNNSFTFNNPLKRKTLKRSEGSRNLYSNYNAEYGKFKRDLQLPIDATQDDILKKGLENSNNFSESEKELLKELE